MKHNTFKRTLAAGLAVLCFAAYAPTFGNTGLFDIAITVSAEGEEKTWPYNNTITEGGVYTCPVTLNKIVVISGGTEDNPVVIKIDGDVTSTVTNYAFTIRNGYVKIIGTNDATISCNGFIRYSTNGSSNKPTGDANITVSDIVVQTSTLNIVNLWGGYNCNTNFEKVTFKNHTSNNSSGAVVIHNIDSTHIFKNCTFEDNTGYYSGAIRLTSVNATMENCTFKNCKASFPYPDFPGGGAIFVDSDTDLTLDNCTIENCTGNFGAISIKNTASLTLKGNTTITDNSTGNIYLTTDATFNVDEDFTGKAGVTTETAPTDTESVTLSTGLVDTQAALANNNIISDNAAYTVKYNNGDLLLVKPVPVIDITLDGSLTLYVGETDTLDATITPENATDQTLTWTSSDTTVVTVDENGNITAVGAGKATITATATNGTESTDDDVNATCEVTVPYEDGIGAQLVGYSLSLDGDIGVNFYMELADDIAASETAYMQFTIPAGSETKTETVPVKKAGSGTANGKTYHVFKCNVSAKDMASTIKAQIKGVDNKSGTEYEYSVKDYADYLLLHTDDDVTYANAAPLVKKLLNYGAASQTYFGIAGTAVNAGLSEAERVIGNVTIPEKFMYNEANTHLPTGVTLAGATLSLKSETTLSLYFTGLPDNTVFTCEGKDNVESVKNGSYMVARIRGIKAKELENDFIVTFNGNSNSVTYNPMTYCYNVLSSNTDENLQNVCKALYQYAEAAKAYSE